MSEFENNQIPQAPAEPQAPVAPQPAVNLPQANQGNPVDQAKDAAQKVLKNPNLPKIAIGVVVAIVVIVILSALLGKGYEKPLDKYMDLNYKGKTQYIEDLLPAEVIEQNAEDVDMDVDEWLEETIEEYEDAMDDMADNYGELEKLDYEITKAKKVSDNKLEDIAEALNENYDIDEDDVKKAYKLTIDGEIEWEDEDQEIDGWKCYSVKIGGSWYLVSEGGYIMY